MYVPLGLGIICILFVAFGYLVLVMYIIELQFRKPSNISEEDMRQIEQSLDKARIETARRKVQALNDITLN
jgi:hypothetical protein